MCAKDAADGVKRAVAMVGSGVYRIQARMIQTADYNFNAIVTNLSRRG
jgi:hypothetical protein